MTNYLSAIGRMEFDKAERMLAARAPDADDIAALRNYAIEYGPKWKDELHLDWYNARLRSCQDMPNRGSILHACATTSARRGLSISPSTRRSPGRTCARSAPPSYTTSSKRFASTRGTTPKRKPFAYWPRAASAAAAP